MLSSALRLCLTGVSWEQLCSSLLSAELQHNYIEAFMFLNFASDVKRITNGLFPLPQSKQCKKYKELLVRNQKLQCTACWKVVEKEVVGSKCDH